MSGTQLPGLTMTPSLQHVARHDSWQNMPHDQQSKGSDASSRTVHRTSSPYQKSTRSRRSLSPRGLRVRNENVPMARNISQTSLSLASSSANILCQRQVSKPGSHKSSWGNESALATRFQGPMSSLYDAGPLYDVDLNACPKRDAQYSDQSPEADNDQALDSVTSFDISKGENLSVPIFAGQKTEVSRRLAPAWDHPLEEAKLLQRFRRTFDPKRRKSLTVRKERWTLDDFEENSVKLGLHDKRPLNGHKKASSWAAFAFASTTPIAAARGCVPPAGFQPHRRSKPSFLRSNRDSIASNAANRSSLDANRTPRKAIELAAWTRAINRRKVLEELVSSEKSYVADLKVLLHVYLTIFDSGPKTLQAERPEFSRNVGDMLRLHEELLRQMEMKLSNSETQSAMWTGFSKRFKHRRWHTSESPSDMELHPSGDVAVNKARLSTDSVWFGRHKKHVLLTTPAEAADVAKLFERMLERLFVYEEYAAKYESMLQNMASLSRTMPSWGAYERGIEALVHSLLPQSSGADENKKGLALEDLLIKPMQRVCRYPLLFAELHRHTPGIDDHQSHTEVEKVLFRLREMAKEINTATNDQKTQARIQRSWNLQDLLISPNTSQSPFSLRALGHASLCGVLYVAYQSEGEVLGNYMLCALFESYMLLAQPRPGYSKFEIAAIMSLGDLQVDNADSAKGLQCYTAPFSWKVMFEHDQQLYEMIFCACTAREEDQWKTSLQKRSTKSLEDGNGLNNISFGYSALYLDIRPLGPVFGQPGTLMRHQSIQRATTLNRRRTGCQVIIRNTSLVKNQDESPTTIPESVGRSLSFSSTQKVPILAPKRADRHRIEQAMVGVWTREQLPFPGMAGNRRGSLITSATTVMRKLSRASTITTSTTNSTTSISRSSIAESSTHSACTAVSRMPLPNTLSSQNPDYCPAVTLTSEAQSPETGKGDQVSQASFENTMTDITKYEEIPNGSKGLKNREVSGTSTLLPNRDSIEGEHGNGKLRKPKTLLKSFSIEGIRSWFH